MGSIDAGSTFMADRGNVHETSLRSPFGQVARRLRETISSLVAPIDIEPGRRVLDFGCADLPYRELFGGAEYLAADLVGNDRATVVIDAGGTLPILDEDVDVVLSTQVLEHVTDPGLYLSECFRVLRPGGHLVLTTHGIMVLHRDPTDYWRWTCDGLRKVVTDAGFEVEDLRGVLGLVATSLQLLLVGAGHRVPRLLRSPMIVAIQLAIGLVERFANDAGRVENGLVLGLRAVKPVSA